MFEFDSSLIMHHLTHWSMFQYICLYNLLLGLKLDSTLTRNFMISWNPMGVIVFWSKRMHIQLEYLILKCFHIISSGLTVNVNCNASQTRLKGVAKSINKMTNEQLTLILWVPYTTIVLMLAVACLTHLATIAAR